MDNIKEHIYLGALLHDIGKFYQRADKSFSGSSNELSDHSRALVGDICKEFPSGYFGYLHTVWTNEFIERTTGILNLVPGIRLNAYDNSGNEDSLANFACNHHRPKTLLQGIITLADWWSAGIDRSGTQTFETEVNKSKRNFKSVPLYSIFNEVNRENKQGNDKAAFLLHELSIDKDRLFPTMESAGASNCEETYRKHWNKFIEEFKELPTGSFNAFSESLLYLLKKYTWCIPSNTNDMADVSLYEHLKTTAAIAHCLYCYYEERPEDFIWDMVECRLSIAASARPVIMVGGDISGIQKFIYNITSSKAAMSLKGRSFYLQLLTDAAIQKILSHTDINATLGQVVYSSGGKFYMLLPNTIKVRAAINTLRHDIEKSLWDTLYGQIALNIETVSFNYDTAASTKPEERILIEDSTSGTNLGNLWKILADKLTRAKARKFETVLQEDFDKMFTPQDVPADHNKVCAVSGIESNDCIKLGSGEDSPFVLPYVKKQVELGKTLKDADYIITYTGDDGHRFIANRAKCDIDILGIHSYLFDKTELARDSADFRGISSVDSCMVKSINSPNGKDDIDFLKAHIKGNGTSYGFQFYGGNKQADNDFTNLAEGSSLGVLRMDVDGLGSIFIKGLNPERRSFSAYSTMSFLLDTFFSGYLNTVREDNLFRDSINILYSGGDDIFVIGRWDRAILFAKRVHEDFARFTGRNDISISGGISIVKPKYPIAKAAEMAGDAEDAAKKYHCGINDTAGKNTINLFGENISWKYEFPAVEKWHNKFLEYFRRGKEEKREVPKSILHRLMRYYQMSKAGDKRYLWLGTYSFARTKQYKDHLAPLCDEIINHCLCNNVSELKAAAIAARWTELELR